MGNIDRLLMDLYIDVNKYNKTRNIYEDDNDDKKNGDDNLDEIDNKTDKVNKKVIRFAANSKTCWSDNW